MRRSIEAWSPFPVAEFRMALRNVFRQKARTALTISIIAAGVAGLMLSGGFVEDALNTLRESTIHAQLGHLQIYKRGYFAEGKRRPYDYLIERPDELIALAKSLPETSQVLSRLGFSGIVNNGRTDYAIVGEGIEPGPEAKLGTRMQVIEGRPLGPDDRFGVMIGEGVASGAGLKVGQTVNLLLNTKEGALNNLEFTIVGVFRTASKDYDARTVRIALPDAQELLQSPSVNAIIVELHDTGDTAAAAAKVRARLDADRFEVVTWPQLADFYEKTATLFKRQFAFLQAVILLSVLLSVANSVNMTIFERTGEFGTLMALGTRRGAIFRLVLIENLFVGLIGSAVGVLLGVLIAAVINGLQIEMPPPPNSNGGYFAGIQVRPSIIVLAFLVGFLATPLTALLPARRIARVPVVDALRMN